jgi:hypothetical protein
VSHGGSERAFLAAPPKLRAKQYAANGQQDREAMADRRGRYRYAGYKSVRSGAKIENDARVDVLAVIAGSLMTKVPVWSI